MALYTQVAYGSSGKAVKELQEALNAHGYSLDVDGQFGTKTRAAVRDYQKKNGLLLDGIAGDQTWGSLMATPTMDAGVYVPTVSSATAAQLRKLEQGYTPSVEVDAADALRRSLADSQPAAYQSGFDAQLKALYDELSARPDFRYDPADDPAYRSYAALYERKGKAAMTDTLGKAAALTGGYSSTYAQSAAQQAYNDYLMQLADVVPDLQEQAWQQYKAQGDDLIRRYQLLDGQEKEAYDRWQDEVNAWQKAVSAAQDSYDSARTQDFKNYQLMLDYYADKAASEAKGLSTSASPAVSSTGNSSTLSSTASDSLRRAMGNYLKSGNESAARTLYEEYFARMSPLQKKQAAALFEKYGLAV